MTSDDEIRSLVRQRAGRPERITEAALARRRPVAWGEQRLMIIAADHPARGSIGVRDKPDAMASRIDLLHRLRTALSRPGVHGVVGTADIVEDLLLMGELDDRLVIGSMNRGGLTGTVFELDDRFTGYDARTIADMGFDGGKMLCRIDPGDPGTASTLEACGKAVTELARGRMMAMVEPLPVRRIDGKAQLDTDPGALIRAIGVGQALGATSAYTWLKLPVVEDMDRVLEATTLPVLLLGGDSAGEQAYAGWQKALTNPGVRGLVVGRALLYPPDDDVAAAVDAAAAMVR
ncbi:MAG: deoxyribose-phosphate aldolase [Hamadaea sp.]|uniref:Cgl0159 family (beta/alpha)8-fold protein n=1 Tax=Hamadaea sp. NPDC050747 TaxID=3155789 RepID=UPI0017AEF7FC|nr:deoxyribose-phosphate aldolase [Hamadaea sp.]NUR50557.1 deoxyribose-phosphate aldolase [Hamadaea sp.]NUT06257.1 deoxyribose-phosphate aldolase [Hamadaea sp.]